MIPNRSKYTKKRESSWGLYPHTLIMIDLLSIYVLSLVALFLFAQSPLCSHCQGFPLIQKQEVRIIVNWQTLYYEVILKRNLFLWGFVLNIGNSPMPLDGHGVDDNGRRCCLEQKMRDYSEEEDKVNGIIKNMHQRRVWLLIFTPSILSGYIPCSLIPSFFWKEIRALNNQRYTRPKVTSLYFAKPQ